MLFRDLQPATKAVYHVITEIKNHKTNRFFWKHEKIADLAGISIKSVKRAIIELQNAGCLKIVRRLPHCNLYEFIEKINLTYDTGQPRPIRQVIHDPCKQQISFNNSLLTTTEWLSENLSNTLIAKYGQQAVNDRVVVINKMNGKIGNKAGLLVASLKGNYIPTSKEFRAKEESDRIKIAVEMKRKEMLEANEKMIADREASAEKKIDLLTDFDKLIAEKAKNS